MRPMHEFCDVGEPVAVFDLAQPRLGDANPPRRNVLGDVPAVERVCPEGPHHFAHVASGESFSHGWITPEVGRYGRRLNTRVTSFLGAGITPEATVVASQPRATTASAFLLVCRHTTGPYPIPKVTLRTNLNTLREERRRCSFLFGISGHCLDLLRIHAVQHHSGTQAPDAG